MSDALKETEIIPVVPPTPHSGGGREIAPTSRAETRARKLAEKTGVPIEVARQGIHLRKFRPPRYKKTKDDPAAPKEMSPDKHDQSLARVAGSLDTTLQTAIEIAILRNSFRIVDGKVGLCHATADAIAAFIHEMRPRDPGESALLLQAVLLQRLFDKAVGAADASMTRPDDFQIYTNQAMKLARAHAGLLQSLHAMRVQPGQQRVVVERVNVAPGGVGVGIVEKAGGEGAEK